MRIFGVFWAKLQNLTEELNGEKWDVGLKKEDKKGFEDVPLVEFMYLVFTRMPGENDLVFVVVLVTYFER